MTVLELAVTVLAFFFGSFAIGLLLALGAHLLKGNHHDDT